MVMPTGSSAPPPTPCTKRAATSASIPGARTHTAEPTAKTPRLDTYTGRRPQRSAIHLVAGCTTTTPNRNDVTTQSTSSRAVQRSLATAGGATPRSAERRGGKEGVSTCRSRGSPYHSKKKTNHNKKKN